MAIERRRSSRAVAERQRWLPRTVLALTCIAAVAAIGVWLSARPAALPTAAPEASNLIVATPAPDEGPPMVVPAGRPALRVPILEYHYIRLNPDPADRLGYNLSVPPSEFAAQMDWLDEHHFHPITLDDLRAYFTDGKPLPAQPVVLTFDDGYQDFYAAAFPTLRAHGFKSVTYVVPGFLNRRDYMTPDELMALDRTGLVEIASHTMYHLNLVAASPADLAMEVGASKTVLEGMLGHPVVDFCYPSGAFNANVQRALTSSGYLTATTELPGTEHSWSDRLAWSRVRVGGGESLADFTASLGVSEPAVLVPSSPRPAAGGPYPR